MEGLNLVSLPSTGIMGEPRRPDSPEKIRDAAEQFEAMLIGQILRSAREASQEKGDCTTEFAEQHLANSIAHSGGLGLASMIARSLSKTPGV